MSHKATLTAFVPEKLQSKLIKSKIGKVNDKTLIENNEVYRSFH